MTGADADDKDGLADRVAALAGGESLAAEVRELEREVHFLHDLGVATSKLAELGRMADAQNHELRQPVMAIRALADFVLDTPGVPDAAREHASHIREQADRMARLLRTLGEVDLAPRPGERCDPGDVARAACGLLAYRLGKRVTLDLEIDGHLPAVRGSADRLEQVLVNLVGNAIDAVEERGKGGVVVRVRGGVRRGEIDVLVADDGAGVPREVRDKLFQPFFTTKGQRGTGLGLCISRGLLRATGGRMELDDAAAYGASWPRPVRTVFRVTLTVAA